jgi:two-component system sensor histidine kinase VanS
MKKIKSSLSAKIFFGIALSLLAVSLLMFGILRVFMPLTYENERDAQTTAAAIAFAKELENAPQTQWENMLVQFCLSNNTGAAIVNEDREQVSGFSMSAFTIKDGGVTQNEDSVVAGFNQTFISGGRMYMVVVYANTEAVDQVTGIFATIFPVIFSVVIVISAIVAFVYSRFLARPIVNISNVSKRMTALDMSWRCDIKRSDEIGALAANLNEMAVKLDSTMKELQTANEKLQTDIEKEREQEKRRRDFFSAISHELKTPVTILKGELDGMILNVGKFKDRDKYLQEAYGTTEAIEKLVREILTLAKLDTLSLNLEKITLSGLAEECSRMYTAMAQSKHIQFESHYKDDVSVSADKEQMRTVLSNIIGNAVKHSPENSTVDIHIAKRDGKAVLSVENSGVHIAPNDLLQIWEPFYRTDKSRSRDTGGSGLGLYIVKSILDNHKLKYAFESTEIGMRFTVIFPL